MTTADLIKKTTGDFGKARRRRLRERQEANVDLNCREYDERRIVLSSTPQRVFLQVNAVCNADCVFCSKGYDYPNFSLEDYRKIYGGELTPVIAQARELILTGSGEFLGLPDAENILNYFNRRFPHVDKFLATNASHGRKIWELIAESDSRYTLQISMHAPDEASHRLMMRYEKFGAVLDNLKYLVSKRDEGGPQIRLMFVMTTLNVEKLPEFVRLAARLGIEEVTAGYFYIYESQQKYLSLYFKQDSANRAIDEARLAAQETGVRISLPPKFGETAKVPEAASCCPEPWHQIMINADGRALPCDVYGRFEADIRRQGFDEIWNGPAYREMRRALSIGEGCIRTCPRQNASAVNRWESHVIHRPKSDKEIAKEYREAMRKP